MPYQPSTKRKTAQAIRRRNRRIRLADKRSFLATQ